MLINKTANYDGEVISGPSAVERLELARANAVQAIGRARGVMPTTSSPDACPAQLRSGGGLTKASGCCEIPYGFPAIMLADQDYGECTDACGIEAVSAASCRANKSLPADLFEHGLFRNTRSDFPLGLRSVAALYSEFGVFGNGLPNSGSVASAASGSDLLFTFAPPSSTSVHTFWGIMFTIGGSLDESALGARVQIAIGPASQVTSAASDVAPVAYGSDGQAEVALTRYFAGDIFAARGRIMLLMGRTVTGQTLPRVATARSATSESVAQSFHARITGLPSGMSASAMLVNLHSPAMADLAAAIGRL